MAEKEPQHAFYILNAPYPLNSDRISRLLGTVVVNPGDPFGGEFAPSKDANHENIKPADCIENLYPDHEVVCSNVKIVRKSAKGKDGKAKVSKVMAWFAKQGMTQSEIDALKVRRISLENAPFKIRKLLARDPPAPAASEGETNGSENSNGANDNSNAGSNNEGNTETRVTESNGTGGNVANADNTATSNDKSAFFAIATLVAIFWYIISWLPWSSSWEDARQARRRLRREEYRRQIVQLLRNRPEDPRKALIITSVLVTSNFHRAGSNGKSRYGGAQVGVPAALTHGVGVSAGGSASRSQTLDYQGYYKGDHLFACTYRAIYLVPRRDDEGKSKNLVQRGFSSVGRGFKNGFKRVGKAAGLKVVDNQVSDYDIQVDTDVYVRMGDIVEGDLQQTFGPADGDGEGEGAGSEDEDVPIAYAPMEPESDTDEEGDTE